MFTRGRLAGFVWGVLAVALSAGCATRRGGVESVSMDRSSTSDTAALAGVWEGQVWETPTHYLQGVRRITLNIGQDGRWTASSGGIPCPSGTASVRGRRVILDGQRKGQDFCVPYSLTSRDGRMKAMFDAGFKGREASAMIDLERVHPDPPEAAEARTRP